MRAALLIAGYLRTFKTTIPKLKSDIIERFEHVDVFIHVTKNESRDDRYLNISNIEEDINFINQELRPVSLICEENTKFKENKRLNDLYNLWFKFYKLNHLKIMNEEAHQRKYDLVIKFRPDLHILSNNLFSGELDRDVVYIPVESVLDKKKLRNPEDKFICDIFAYGNSSVMDRYFNVFQALDYLTERHGQVSETILFHYLADHGVAYHTQDIEYNILLSSCNIFAICGDSGSGKSTLGNVLKQYFSSSFMLEGDRYHKWERHDDNWKEFTHLNPESNFLTKMSQDIFDLKVGKTIYQVDYDHATGKFTDKEQIGSSDNIIVCGLNSLYLDNNNLFNLKIFIDTDERLKHHWKIRRDVHERGHTIEHVLEQIASRKNDYEQFIASQRSKSDLVIKFYPRIDNPELFETLENLSLKLYIRTTYNLREILDAFLERDVVFQMKKSELFYELTFEHYQECKLWDNRLHPHTNNFYDYIVLAITLLKSP